MKPMNPDLALLQPYPFEKLNALLAQVTAAELPHIALSIGEPKHPAPQFARDILIDNLAHLSTYPSSKGLPVLREAIAGWLQRRFGLQQIDPDTQILPVSGTREALFSFTQALIDRQHSPYVVMPNPFYQIYEGAALLAGAQPYFYNCDASNGYKGNLNDIPAEVWQNTQLVFVCSPNNPTGAVFTQQDYQKLIALSDQYGFVIASDECYSEIWFETPPVGLLEVCQNIGRHDYRNCVVFHSLSKRSNLPGLRSGFVAGDAALLQPYLLYRTYHGAAMPVQHQLVSVAAWNDEQHVEENRIQYRQKFELFEQQLGHLLPLRKPDAGFYYWLNVDDDEQFALTLRCEANITVLAGRYLSRPTDAGYPGCNHVRMALVASLAECEEAARRIRQLLERAPT